MKIGLLVPFPVIASFGEASLVTVFFAGGFLVDGFFAEVFFVADFFVCDFLTAGFFAGGFLAGIIRPKT